MEVRPKDVLLRVGGRTLHRTGYLAAQGAGRGFVEVKETFARAAVRRFRDRDGFGRKAAAGFVAIEYPGAFAGLVDQFGYPFCGPLVEGARTQLVPDPENFGNWIVQGVVARTAGQADPFGGTNAYLLDSNTPAAADAIYEVVAFTADATKNILGFVRAGTATQSAIAVYDNTAAVQRHRVLINWAAGVP